MFLSCTGCRIGESVALRKSDFNVSKDRITVMLPAHITKTRESRITFVSKEVEPLLLELLNKKGKDELVFGTHQVPKYSKDSITQMFGIIRKNAGFCSCSKDGKDNCMGKYKSSPLHKITIHSFRAFFIKNINRVDFGLGYITPGYCAESEFSNELRVQKYDCPSFDSKSEKSITDSQTTQNNCDPLYPDFCIPSSPPDLDCKDISQKRFTVIQPDPHRFDADRDGIGCESG